VPNKAAAPAVFGSVPRARTASNEIEIAKKDGINLWNIAIHWIEVKNLFQ
jgi:hypothetical protein